MSRFWSMLVLGCEEAIPEESIQEDQAADWFEQLKVCTFVCEGSTMRESAKSMSSRSRETFSLLLSFCLQQPANQSTEFEILNTPEK